MEIEKIKLGKERRIVVVKDGKVVYTASKPGHTVAATGECLKWIEGQKYDLDHYRASAARNVEIDEWTKAQRGKMPRVERPSIITPTGFKSRW